VTYCLEHNDSQQFIKSVPISAHCEVQLITVLGVLHEKNNTEQQSRFNMKQVSPYQVPLTWYKGLRLRGFETARRDTVEINEDHTNSQSTGISPYPALRQAPKSVTGLMPDKFQGSTMAMQ